MRGHGGTGGRRHGLRRRARLGVGGVGATLAVAGLWWWSLGASDPMAPGAATPTADAADGVVVGSGARDVGGLGGAVLSGGSGVSPSGGGESGGGSPEALARVTTAAQRAADAPTSRFTLTMALAGDPAAAPLTVATGVVDAGSGSLAMELRQWDPAVASSATTLEVVAVADLLYVRSPSLDSLGGSPSWWRMEVGTGVDALEDSGASPAAVSGLVGLVAAAHAAEELGPTTEDGVAVTRLRVELPRQGTTAGLPGADQGWAVVGIAEDGGLRSVEVVGSGAWGAAAGRSVVVRLVLDALGEPVDIRVPDPVEVRDPAGIRVAGGR